MGDQSKLLFERAKKISPGGVHSPVRAFKNVETTPRFMVNGCGAAIEDVDGHRYIDYCLSWGPLIFGHADPDVKESVISAIEKGWTYGTADTYSLELGEIITSAIPWVKKIRFVNSGTEAVMSALRLARAATGRNKILKFDGCYHGHVDSMLVKAGSGLADMASPDSAGVSQSTAEETLVAPLDDLEAVEKIISLHANDVAAVIVEPIPANNGLLLQRANFLKELRILTRKLGVILIFDEVITGFRLAFGGAGAYFGVEPDLVTYGKVIGGGFPVGAFGGGDDLMDLVAPSGPVYQAGTLSANPVAMAAGIATLRKLQRANPYHILEARTTELGNNLQRRCHELGLPVTAQSCGSIFWMALGDVKSEDKVVRNISQIPEAHKSWYGRLYPKLLKRGFYLAPSGYEVGFMSTVHTSEMNEGLVTALVDSICMTLEG